MIFALLTFLNIWVELTKMTKTSKGLWVWGSQKMCIDRQRPLNLLSPTHMNLFFINNRSFILQNRNVHDLEVLKASLNNRYPKQIKMCKVQSKLHLTMFDLSLSKVQLFRYSKVSKWKTFHCLSCFSSVKTRLLWK